MTIAATAPSVADLNGLPFLDDAFASRGLLALTAAVRHAAARQRGLTCGIAAADAQAWLWPAQASLLSTSSTPMPALPLPAARRQQVTDTLAALASGMPQWRLLLQLPVRYARLYPANGAISASSRDWPQHVLLAGEAFTTSRELREQVLHELAHQWLYLAAAGTRRRQPHAAVGDPRSQPSRGARRSTCRCHPAAPVPADRHSVDGGPG